MGQSDEGANCYAGADPFEDAISGYRALEQGLADNVELIELAEAEGDDGVLAEAESALSELKSQAAKQQLESLLSGEADANDCFLETHAGAGGTEIPRLG